MVIRALTLALTAALTLGACAGPIEPEPGEAPMTVGERRRIQITRPTEPAGPRRFDRTALLALPAEALARTWALDWPLLGTPDRRGLLDAALAGPAKVDPPLEPDPGSSQVDPPLEPDPGPSQVDPPLGPPLEPGSSKVDPPLGPDPGWLRWTTLDLDDPAWPTTTTLGPLYDLLGPADAAAALATALDRAPATPLLPPRALAQALAHQLIHSHPQARRRPGDAASDTPPAPDHLPLSLADLLLAAGAPLAARLGPHHAPGAYHPGALAGLRLQPPPDDLLITIRFARPPPLWAAIDLAAGASRPLPPWTPVDDLIDPDDPDWLTVDGSLSLEPRVEALTLSLAPSDRPPDQRGWTTGPQPAPRGGADAWQAAPWTLERITLDAAYRAYAATPDRQTTWPADAPRLHLSQRAGWLGLEGPGLPAGIYLWEAIAEACALALTPTHPADAAPLTLHATDLPAGLDRPQWTAALRAALARQPAATAALALAALAPPGPSPPDLVLDLDADPPRLIAVAPAAEVPGPRFFADPALTRPLDAEDLTEAGRPWTPLAPGGRVYCLNASGSRYALSLGPRAGASHSLELHRLD